MQVTDGDYTSYSPNANDNQRTLVVDRGSDYLKRFRTEVPNMVWDMGLDPYERALYTHYKWRAGTKGVCYQSIRGIAEDTCMSVGKVAQARDSLQTRGLIEVVKSTSRKRADEVLIVDIWAENISRYAEEPSVHVVNTNDSSVHETIHKSENEPSSVHVVTHNNTNLPTNQQAREIREAREDEDSLLADRCLEVLRRLDQWTDGVGKTMERWVVHDMIVDYPEEDPLLICHEFVLKVAEGAWTINGPITLALRGFFKHAAAYRAADANKIASITREARPGAPRTASGGVEDSSPDPVSPQAVVDALENYENPTGGPNDLRKYASLARDEWNFTQDERPPFRIFARLGGTDDERARNHKRIKSVARRAINGEREVRLAS